MARIIPSDITRLALAGVHEPELQTLALLKDRLPDDYSVFHGVHWSRQYKGSTLFGEIDFVIINRSGEVLCIEQKNGPLTEKDGKLFKEYGQESKNVGDQIHRSLNSIRQKYAHQNPGSQRLHLDYLIYCPEHAVCQLSAAGIDRERVVDAPRRDDLSEIIQAILPPGHATAHANSDAAEAFFRQTFEVVPDIHAHVGAQEKNFVRLSGGLVDVLDNIEMDPLRLRVLATAGNGKTLVAGHFFDKTLVAGKQPLLLCFNRPLKEKLRHLAKTGGMVETWYGFCDRFLQSKDIKLDFAQMAGNPNFWQDAARLVSETVLNDGTPEEWLFDTLIIDEAQDFEEGWFEIVRLFLKDDSDILWLEDPNQNVRGVAPPALKDLGFVGYRSLLNLRSPETIARFIRQTLPDFEFTCANDLPGLGVGVTSYEEPADQPKVVGKIVGRLLSDRFKQTQIAVLSCKGLNSTVFKDIQRVGNHTLSRFTGQYDLFGNQIFSNGQILFDTVRRFKGQQAAAVILTDIDPNESHLREDLSVVFCGMTRATVRLEIVCNRSNEWIHEKLLPAI